MVWSLCSGKEPTASLHRRLYKHQSQSWCDSQGNNPTSSVLFKSVLFNVYIFLLLLQYFCLFLGHGFSAAGFWYNWVFMRHISPTPNPQPGKPRHPFVQRPAQNLSDIAGHTRHSALAGRALTSVMHESTLTQFNMPSTRVVLLGENTFIYAVPLYTNLKQCLTEISGQRRCLLKKSMLFFTLLLPC